MPSGSFNRVGIVLGLSLASLAPASSHADWSTQESGTTVHLHAIQFLDAQVGYAVGESGTVLKTSDGGANWSDVSIATADPVRDLSMISASTGWVAVGDPDNSEISGAVWHTTDGGMMWSEQSINSTRARFGISFVSPTTGWACGARNGAIDIEATTDGGSTWISQSASDVFGWTYGIDAVSSSLVWSCGIVFFPSESGFVVHTTDGGAQWSAQNTGTIPLTYGIDFANSTVGFIAGDEGTILATTNGGSSWTADASGSSANLAGISFSGPLNGAACGAGGTILTTTDGGGTWVGENTPTSVTLNGIFALDASHAWAVGDDGTILKRETASGAPDAPPGAAFTLLRGYPNPVGHGTAVSYRLPDMTRLSLAVYDAAGRRVALLADGEQTAGAHRVVWDGRDRLGRMLPSGSYYVVLRARGRDPVSFPLVLVR